ncbi:hypothetical protein BDP27DRAFT_1374400 [Rhodocollybia butyracea]|uniref:Uncharacterized protein n=1 Tax=Rhodocollybia butyracea TaxID=206335 RepID=A0A9P5TWK3_9AGAR|nr:hypothetical protein BDP27DRAFT_1374400 [Rhodocollybia butyracea]
MSSTPVDTFTQPATGFPAPVHNAENFLVLFTQLYLHPAASRLFERFSSPEDVADIHGLLSWIRDEFFRQDCWLRRVSLFCPGRCAAFLEAMIDDSYSLFLFVEELHDKASAEGDCTWYRRITSVLAMTSTLQDQLGYTSDEIYGALQQFKEEVLDPVVLASGRFLQTFLESVEDRGEGRSQILGKS